MPMPPTAPTQNEPRAPHRVTLIPGEGIGPEVSAAARRVLDATGVSIEWDLQIAGRVAYERHGSALPEGVIDSIRERGVALKGPLTTASGGYRSPNLALRNALDLYAGVRPCRALAGVPTPFPGTDLVIVRMNQEDLYAGIEFAPGRPETERLRALVGETTGHELAADAGISLKPISRSGAARVIRTAFEYARRYRRDRVTAVHKATVMRHSDGLFLDVAREIAGEYPEIAFDERLVDALCHDLVRRPESYEVLVAPMMYGDIVSDIGAGLIGGVGMAPGANIGDRCVVFEAVHGSATRHAGAGRANPIATILCGAMLLAHLGEAAAAELLGSAIATVVGERRVLTYDLIPGDADAVAAGTQEVAEAVIEAMSR